MTEDDVEQLKVYAQGIIEYCHENFEIIISNDEKHLFLGQYAPFPEKFVLTKGECITLKAVLKFVKDRIKQNGYTCFSSETSHKKLLMNTVKSAIGIFFNKSDISLKSCNMAVPITEASEALLETAIEIPELLSSHLKDLFLGKLVAKLNKTISKFGDELDIDYECSVDVKKDSVSGTITCFCKAEVNCYYYVNSTTIAEYVQGILKTFNIKKQRLPSKITGYWISSNFDKHLRTHQGNHSFNEYFMQFLLDFKSLN